MTYRVLTELSPKPFYPGDEVHVSSSSGEDFYVNFEDWEGKYKLFIQFQKSQNTLMLNEMVRGDWNGAFSFTSEKSIKSKTISLSLSYDKGGNYLIKFGKSQIVFKASIWPGEIRQVGSENKNLKVALNFGEGHTNNTESIVPVISDDLMNEMLA